jgi:serine/tyrosine/threonine adenylyltransferase
MRIGSFQRLSTIGDPENLQRLVIYCLEHYFGEGGGDDAPVRLLQHVVERTAKMAARFMMAGFVHGVLNSDNINITGESFDYGPWRWAPRFEAGFTAAYFDESGLYSFGRQAEAIHWDVVQLAIALNSIAQEEPLIEALGGFGPAYFVELKSAMLWRLGVDPLGTEADSALVQSMEAALSASWCSIDQFFFDWRGGAARIDADYEGEMFDALRHALGGYTKQPRSSHPYWHRAVPCSMLIDEVEALWQPIAERDDWSGVIAKVSAIREMGEALKSL